MTELAKKESPPLQETDAVLSVIERAASNPDVDIEKMERLLAMKERMDAQNAERAFSEAFARVQAEKKKVYANAANKQTSSRYATYEALDDALTPIITGNGFSCSFDTDVSPLGPEHIRILVDVMHVGGHTKVRRVDLPIDMVGIAGKANKTETHGRGSSMSYGRRYAKLLAFDVAITDEDDDGQAAQPQPKYVAMTEAMGRHADSIDAIREALDDNNYSFAYECWGEIPEEDQKSLWQAPTKVEAAGFVAPLTTEHRAKMKSNEWAACRQAAQE